MIPLTTQSEEVALKVGISSGTRYRDNTEQSSLPVFHSPVSWSALLKEVRK